MKYRAVVIDGKRILKNIVASVCALSILSVILMFLINTSVFCFQSPEDMIGSTISAIGIVNNFPERKAESLKTAADKIIQILFNVSPHNAHTFFDAEYPLIRAVNQSALISGINNKDDAEKQNEPTPVPPPSAPPQQENIAPENARQIKNINASPNKDGSKKIVISNETNYSIDVDSMLSEPLNINLGVSGPKILIVHTHATEAYSPAGAEQYDKTASDRSEDLNLNVVKVGEEIAKTFNTLGIETVHDTKLHDVPSFNGSYSNSLKTVLENINRYPSIQIVFDVHRDSVVYADETKARTVTEINGKNAAQLMFVVGTDARGLSHPNWRENMKFAVKMQNAINQKYPTLMRHINLRTERFNGHTTGASVIIEVGTSGNSLEEAIYGATLAAGVIADELKK